MFEGYENFNVKMDDDPSTEETSVEVAVKVAEETEAESSLQEAASELESTAVASDQGASAAEQLEMCYESIQRYGITPQGMQMMDYKGVLSRISGRQQVAFESLDVTGPNSDAAEIAMESIQDTLKAWGSNIKKFFKKTWEYIKSAFRWIVERLTSWEGSLKSMRERLKAVSSVDEKALKDKKVSALKHDDFEKLCQAIHGAHGFLAEFVGNSGHTDAATWDKARARNAVVKVIKGKAKDILGPLGLDMDDEGDIKGENRNAVAVKSDTLSGLGWDKAKALAACDEAAKILAENRTLPKIESSVKTLIDAAEKSVNSLEASSVDNAGETKQKRANVEGYRTQLSAISKVIAKVVSKSALLPRTVMSVGHAIADAGKAKK